MTDTLHRLVYLSRNDISGTNDTLQSEMSQILRSARENNSKRNVTGALMFNAEVFAQVLEGPHDELESLFAHIESDERHSEISMLDFGPVESRGFPEWAMAYVGDESTLTDRFFMMAEETNFDPDSLSGDQVFDVLRAGLTESDVESKFNSAA